jgi:uncharacterized membrane protein YkvA (DUF1232 family)
VKLAEATQLYRAETTPTRVKIALVFLLAYLLCPIDIIPDFIPVLGQLDDILVAGLVVGYITRVLAEQARYAEDTETEGHIG